MSTTVPASHALTVAAAAAALSLSEKTVRRAVARGEIGAIRIGRSIRIPEAELARLLEPRGETDED